MCRNKVALETLIGNKGKSANEVSAHANLPHVTLFIRRPTVSTTVRNPSMSAPTRKTRLRLCALLCASLIQACTIESSDSETGSQSSNGAKPPNSQQQTPKPQESEEQQAILNYIAYSDTFASAGQPTAEQLAQIKEEGVQRVIYLAFSDQERSLPAEDRIVKGLGMNYLQVPVDWNAPQKREYYLFAQAMQIEPERKTLLHCQLNFRASAFAFLYRVLHQKVPLAQAKADMNSIWVPNSIWTNLILDILQENKVDPYCEGCDWTPSSDGS